MGDYLTESLTFAAGSLLVVGIMFSLVFLHFFLWTVRKWDGARGAPKVIKVSRCRDPSQHLHCQAAIAEQC